MGLDVEHIEIGEPTTLLEPNTSYDDRLAHEAVVLPISFPRLKVRGFFPQLSSASSSIANGSLKPTSSSFLRHTQDFDEAVISFEGRELPFKFVFSEGGRMERVRADGVLFPPEGWDPHSFRKYKELHRMWHPIASPPNPDAYRYHRGWIAVNGKADTDVLSIGVDIQPRLQSSQEDIDCVAKVTRKALHLADYWEVSSLATRPLGIEVNPGYPRVGLYDSFRGTILGIDRYARTLPVEGISPTVGSLLVVLDVDSPCYQTAETFRKALETILQT